MTRPIFGFGVFGMGGRGTDPDEITFSARVASLGVHIGNSPYMDYQTNEIAAAIDTLPTNAIIFVWGTSLGANDCTVIASRTKRTIHGIFGFQASIYGAKVPVPSTVLFAHLIYSYNPIPFPGLGAYKWKPGQGFDPVRLHLTPHHLRHPGDWDKGDQEMYLREMQRIKMNPGD